MKCQKHRSVKHRIILSFSVDWVSNTLDSLVGISFRKLENSFKDKQTFLN